MTLEELESTQVCSYFIALVLGALVGFLSPSTGLLGEGWIEPLLGVLLYAMFAQIPFLQLWKAFSHWRFMAALGVANFMIVPLLIWLMTRLLPEESPLLLGVSLVLLAPCIDYVVVFTQLGRGDAKLMLAATPLLLLLQIILVPLYLWLILGDSATSLFSAAPVLKAFVVLILIPLVLAIVTEWVGGRLHIAQRWQAATAWLPVPLMALVLFAIVASQLPKITDQLSLIGSAIPFFVAFMLIMPVIARVLSHSFRLEAAAGRALVFGASTRNSLVVLPLAFALPDSTRTLVAAVIVTQTLVELVGEVIYVRVVPKWVIPDQQ
ncbi:arsenic resistance protein [Allohahella sp. A8]|mgnify:CR=1 FL=1|uniref:arsenic resistance protein n=1 Tax=Allohahella sp. A8 TaxID=3141461 RepID=UPI000C098E71|nr:arsenic resistance protein [Hahellaceae bacterium]